MKLLLELYTSFFKMGLFMFGGGYVMLPLMQKELVEGKGWLSNDDVANYFAIGQCLPGAIAVNTSMFVGIKIKGRIGGIAATFGLMSPSLIHITIVAAFIQNFIDLRVVQNAFWGIRIVICALILQAIINLWGSTVKDAFGLCVYLAVLLLALLTPIPAFAFVISAVIAGILAGIIKRRRAAP